MMAPVALSYEFVINMQSQFSIKIAAVVLAVNLRLWFKSFEWVIILDSHSFSVVYSCGLLSHIHLRLLVKIFKQLVLIFLLKRRSDVWLVIWI